MMAFVKRKSKLIMFSVIILIKEQDLRQSTSENFRLLKIRYQTADPK